MTIARSRGAFIGTSESSTFNLSHGATKDSGQVDLLGDDTSTGEVTVWAVWQPAGADPGNPPADVTVTIYMNRATGQSYVVGTFTLSLQNTSSQKRFLGRFKCSRYAQVIAVNGSATYDVGLSVLYELEKTT